MFWEYAKIVSTYNVTTGQGLVDRRKLEERGLSKEKIDMVVASSKGVHESLNLRLTPGFEDLEYDYFDYYYSLFNSYEKGTMPFPGSPTEQPSKIIEIFEIIKSLQLEYERRERKKQEREMRKKRK